MKSMKYGKLGQNIRMTDNHNTGYYLYKMNWQANSLVMNKRQINRNYLLVIVMLSIVLLITGYELQVLQSELLIHKMITKEIDYEGFRRLQINEDILVRAEAQSEKYVRNNPDLIDMPYADKTGYLTFCMMANSYNPKGRKLVDEKTFCRGIVRLSESQQFQKLYGYYKSVITDLKFFPVPMIADQSADISYVDSWYQPRTYGGNRKHEGTDLMASNNERGFFPVISITDGTVEKMGWLEQGGYRVGIRASSGGYFYYAHLSSYAPELKEGDTVIAGQLLGFMGDSGYGSEGTVGQFDVHLHLGIYVDTDQGEMSINPYWILKMLEKNRTLYKKI